jgi:hypothetical protein
MNKYLNQGSNPVALATGKRPDAVYDAGGLGIL